MAWTEWAVGRFTKRRFLCAGFYYINWKAHHLKLWLIFGVLYLLAYTMAVGSYIVELNSCKESTWSLSLCDTPLPENFCQIGNSPWDDNYGGLIACSLMPLFASALFPVKCSMGRGDRKSWSGPGFLLHTHRPGVWFRRSRFGITWCWPKIWSVRPCRVTSRKSTVCFSSFGASRSPRPIVNVRTSGLPTPHREFLRLHF